MPAASSPELHSHTPSAVLLMGPTASGKSRVALELAQRLPVEIVSVDSAQVYRGMDIGTAKPSAAERASVPHHLIDILPPTEAYSAALFRADALRVIGQIRSRARLPLLVGGTMLYFKALLEGLSRLPSANAQIRAEIEAEAQDLGWPALHTRLAAVDPDTAARLKPRDSQRIQRALEVYRITGEPMSRLLFHPPPLAGEGREGAFLSIALLPADRARLHQRISARLTEMLSRGLVEEVEALRQKYALSSELPSMRSVGYRQVWQHLEGELDRDELKDRAIYATRQLAKRQMTWLRSWPECSVFDCFAPALSGKLYEVINRAGERPGSI